MILFIYYISFTIFIKIRIAKHCVIFIIDITTMAVLYFMGSAGQSRLEEKKKLLRR